MYWKLYKLSMFLLKKLFSSLCFCIGTPFRLSWSLLHKLMNFVRGSVNIINSLLSITFSGRTILWLCQRARGIVHKAIMNSIIIPATGYFGSNHKDKQGFIGISQLNTASQKTITPEDAKELFTIWFSDALEHRDIVGFLHCFEDAFCARNHLLSIDAEVPTGALQEKEDLQAVIDNLLVLANQAFTSFMKDRNNLDVSLGYLQQFSAAYDVAHSSNSLTKHVISFVRKHTYDRNRYKILTKEDWEILHLQRSPSEVSLFDEEQCEGLEEKHQQRTGKWLDLSSDRMPKLEKVRIVLLGQAGSGRSSSGNNILGDDKFKVGAGSTVVTKTVQVGECIIDDVKVIVVDTPDFLHGLSQKNLRFEEAKILDQCSDGVHAFLMYLNGSNARLMDTTVLRNMLVNLNPSVYTQMIAVITRPDNALMGKNIVDLLTEIETMHDEELQPLRQFLVKDIQKRVTGYENNNKYEFERSSQNKHLFHMIEQMVEEAGVYTNEKFEKVQELVSEYDEEILERKLEMREECLAIPEQSEMQSSYAMNKAFGEEYPKHAHLTEYLKIISNREAIGKVVRDIKEKNLEISRTVGIKVENVELINRVIQAKLDEYHSVSPAIQTFVIEADVKQELDENIHKDKHETLLAFIPAMVESQKSLFNIINEATNWLYRKIEDLERLVVEALYEFNPASNEEIYSKLQSHMSHVEEDLDGNPQFRGFYSWNKWLCQKRQDRLLRIYDILNSHEWSKTYF